MLTESSWFKNFYGNIILQIFCNILLICFHFDLSGLPTVLVAHTSKDATLDIDWDKFTSGNQSEMAGSIKFSNSKDVYYSFAVAFTRVKFICMFSYMHTVTC